MSPSMVARRPIALDVPVRVTSRNARPRTSSVPLKVSPQSPLSTGTDFAGEDGLVQQDTASLSERAVGRDAVASLEAHPVARHQGLRREADQSAVSEDPRVGAGERFQSRQGGFGPVLLIEAERRVEHEDHPDGGRFDRLGLHAFVQPEREVEGEGEQKDVDERARELSQKAPPRGIGNPFGQCVRPDAGEAFGRVGSGQSVHRCAMRVRQ